MTIALIVMILSNSPIKKSIEDRGLQHCNLQERDFYEELGVDYMTILKWILKKWISIR